MEQEQIQRLNYLAEKAQTDTATPSELNELKLLMDAWNVSTRVDLLSGTYLTNKNE